SEYEKEMTPRKAGWIVKEKLKLGRKRISGGFILEAKKSDIERLKLKFGIKDTEATEANQIEQEKGTAIEPD
ncbi:MAG: hypothetical protein RLY43_1440, partial [Bacteroidota bacterium]